jgi:hypothetical protein
MTEATAPPKSGCPTWLTVLVGLMGGFATILGLVASVEYLFNHDEPSTFPDRLLLFLVGVGLLGALWLVRRAQLVSVALSALGGVAFGVLMYWMIVPIFAGIAVAIGAVLSTPRVLEPRV